MNFWVLTVLRLRPKLEAMCAKLNKRAESLALSMGGDTYKLYNDILDINEKKTLLINLKVLFDSFLQALLFDERQIIVDYAKNATLEEIAAAVGIHRSTAMRRINKAVKKCICRASELGYTLKKFESDYSGIPLVKNTYNLILKEHLIRGQAARGSRKVQIAESDLKDGSESVICPQLPLTSSGGIDAKDGGAYA